MQPLPGFRDFLPNDCATRNYVFARWREVARRYGFVEWDGPVLEPTALYTKKSGPEIVAQLFNFIDKGDREVAMRPELTPTLARVVAAHDREFKKPLKWFSIPQCFRYEKQQRGRLREHYQFNADVIGEASVEADVELIALCVDLLRAFGFTAEDVVVRISDREFWIDFLRTHNLPEAQWQEILQAIDKSEREPREKTASRLGPLAEPIFKILDEGGQSEKLDRLLASLKNRGMAEFVKIDLGIVRGLAYYSGVVFEAFDRGGKLRALAGGGRYDNLIQQLSDGAVSLPALGFAMGDVVLGELIGETPVAKKKMEEAIADHQNLDIYVVIAKEERRADALAQIQSLRDRGHRVDFPLTPMKVGKQFQAAEQLGARLAILFGDEWPQVKVKDLKTGDQKLVPQTELLNDSTTMSTLRGRTNSLPPDLRDSSPRPE
ncbi:MAG: histidine--tRNA ligase [Verrucomicrobia bacterium]|nr:MAG: histidine--tRNA ligase [Verrucomicrobiota bacterium]